MSAAAVAFDRVEQIQAMLAALQPPIAATSTPSTSFASSLQAATATTASTGATSGAASTTPFAAEIDAAAQRHGIDPSLLRGLIRQESGFDPNARSSAGAIGLCQLMPATAAGLGISNPSDPVQNIEGGAKYLRQQLDRFGGDVTKALAAYNAGPGAVQRYGGVPPYAETQAYVQRVTAYAEEYRREAGRVGTELSTASAALSASPLVTAALGVATPTVPAAAAPSSSSSGLGYSTT